MIILKKNFYEELYKVYSFGYVTNEQKQEYSEEAKKLFLSRCKKHITDRINILYNASEYIIIEENYVEPEWKTMVKEHYINSAYSNNLKQRVIRVHFLNNDVFSEENYLGFITLRPLEEIEIALSFVYLNWKHEFFADYTTFVMTYPKEIHYIGKTITIFTYPFFAQDSIVTCCADANVIMLKKYFANKFKISTTGKNSCPILINNKEHKLPRTVTRILLESMLSQAEIPFSVYLNNENNREKTDWTEVQNKIDAYIESGLPVILGVNKHVVQIIGYANSKNGDNKGYIIYDDSGHLEKMCHGQENKDRHFSYIVQLNDIRNFLEQNENYFLLFSEHERVYMKFEYYKHHLRFHLTAYKIQDTENESIYPFIINDKKQFQENVSLRTMLVDNSVVKSFYLKQSTEEQKKCIKEFLYGALPHYLWYTEITVHKENDKIICLCADPTMYYRTNDLKKLFLYMPPIAIVDNDRLMLLTKSNP